MTRRAVRLRGLAPELGRFLATAVMGLAIDLGIAWAAIVHLGLPDPVAAAVGLFAGMVFNYVLHLTWTFREAGRRASLGHFLQFAAAVGITLVIRIACLLCMDAFGWQDALAPPVRLGIAAVASFAASFLLCRYVIFARPETSAADR